MNRYTLIPDNQHWWWPSAAAGAVSAAAIAAILATPFAGHAIPVDDAPPASVLPAAPSGADTHDGPCFLRRSVWNDGLDGPQPTCSRSAVRVSRTHAVVFVPRTWLDHRPSA